MKPPRTELEAVERARPTTEGVTARQVAQKRIYLPSDRDRCWRDEWPTLEVQCPRRGRGRAGLCDEHAAEMRGWAPIDPPNPRGTL